MVKKFDDATMQALKSIISESVNVAVANAFAVERTKSAMMTSSEVMESLKISRTSLWRLTKEGKLKGVHGRGREILYRSDEVNALLNADK